MINKLNLKISAKNLQISLTFFEKFCEMNVTDNFQFFREKSRTVRAWFYLVTPDETTPGIMLLYFLPLILVTSMLVTDVVDVVGDKFGMLMTS